MAIIKSKSSFAVSFDGFDQSKSLEKQIEQNPEVRQEVSEFLDTVQYGVNIGYRITELLGTSKPQYEGEWKKNKLITTKGMWMMKQIRRRFGSVNKMNVYNQYSVFYDILFDMVGYLNCMDREKFTEIYGGMAHLKELFLNTCNNNEKVAVSKVRKYEYNPCKKYIKRAPTEYNEVTSMISKYDYKFIKQILRKSRGVVKRTGDVYYNYFRQKYVRQDEEAAKVFEKKGFVRDIKEPYNKLRQLLYVNREDEMALCKQAVECYYAIIEDRLAYYQRGRIAILNDAIYNGTCPKDYLIVDGAYCEENQSIPLTKRNEVIQASLNAILSENIKDEVRFKELKDTWSVCVHLFFSNISCHGRNTSLCFSRNRLTLTYQKRPKKSITKGVEHIPLPWNYTKNVEGEEYVDFSKLLKVK